MVNNLRYLDRMTDAPKATNDKAILSIKSFTEQTGSRDMSEEEHETGEEYVFGLLF